MTINRPSMKPTSSSPGATPRSGWRPLARSLALLFLVTGLTRVAATPLAVYTFGSSSPTAGATTSAAGLDAGDFAGLTGAPGLGTGSPLFTAGSGGAFFTASGWRSGTPGVNWFEFTLTPQSGYQFTTSELSFGYRATSSGPTAFAVRSSLDGFVQNLAAGGFAADSLWHSSGLLPVTLALPAAATTFRLYGWGASSTAGTLRVDDVAVFGSTAANVPDSLAGPELLAVLAALVLARRRWAGRGGREPVPT